MFAPPPLILAAALLATLGLERLWPLPLLPDVDGRTPSIVLGAVALVIFGAAAREFHRAKTSVHPHRPTTAIIRRGVYRVSRNPLYLAMALIQIAATVRTHSAWGLIMSAGFVAVMTKGVIEREERYLERKFGREYLDYRASVRRWI